MKKILNAKSFKLVLVMCLAVFSQSNAFAMENGNNRDPGHLSGREFSFFDAPLPHYNEQMFNGGRNPAEIGRSIKRPSRPIGCVRSSNPRPNNSQGNRTQN